MVKNLGVHTVHITRYLNDTFVDSFEENLPVRQYENGRYVCKYGPLSYVELIDGQFHLRIDMVDFTDLMGKVPLKDTKKTKQQNLLSMFKSAIRNLLRMK